MLPKHVRYQTALHPVLKSPHRRRRLFYSHPIFLSRVFLKKSLIFCKQLKNAENTMVSAPKPEAFVGCADGQCAVGNDVDCGRKRKFFCGLAVENVTETLQYRNYAEFSPSAEPLHLVLTCGLIHNIMVHGHHKVTNLVKLSAHHYIDKRSHQS